jgi:hypothetical protein
MAKRRSDYQMKIRELAEKTYGPPPTWEDLKSGRISQMYEMLYYERINAFRVGFLAARKSKLRTSK